VYTCSATAQPCMVYFDRSVALADECATINRCEVDCWVLLPALSQTPLLFLAFCDTHTTSSSMTSITSSTSANGITNSQPGVVSLAVTNRPLEPSARPDILHATTRATRRRGKRDGPVQFRFVTATDPSHFKDEGARRSVRSQAMRYHRNKANDGNATPRQRPGIVLLSDTRPISTAHAMPSTVQEQSYIPTASLSTFGAPLHYADEQQTETHSFTRPRSTSDASGAQPQATEFEFECSGSARPDRHTSLSRSYSKDIEKVVDYDYTESQQERKIRLLATTFCRIGDGVDPFIVLPQFKNDGLNSVFLLRNCKHTSYP
jgi:hypothetical protein